MRSIRLYAPLLCLTAYLSVVDSLYVAHGEAPPDAVLGLSSFGLALSFILWAAADAHRRGRTPCHEFGFLVAVYFPLSLIWYVLWTRGWWGVGLLAAFALLPGVPWAVALLVQTALGG